MGIPQFRRLFAARSISYLGDWVALIALASLVYDETGSAIASAGLMVAIQVLPAIVAPALIGRLELGDPRRTLVGLGLLEALAFGALALIAENFLLVAVLAIAAADGTLALSTRALSRASLSALLAPSGQLRAGNALINLGANFAVAAGPVIGGVLVVTIGPGSALLVNAATFLLSALILATLGDLPSHLSGEDAADGAVTGWRERLRTGLAYVRRQPQLARLIAAQAAALAFFSLTVPVDVVYANESLGAGDRGFGFLVGAWGLGTIIGALLFAGALRFTLPNLIAGSTLVIGLGYLGLAVAPGLALACLAAVVGGTGNGVQWVAVVTTIQEMIASSYQARVVGLLESAASIADAVGFALGGLIAALVAPRVSYLVAGLGVLVVLSAALGTLRSLGPVRGTADAPVAR